MVNRYEIHFATFSPLYMHEKSMKNAVIRAKFQRLEEGLSTDVLAVRTFDQFNGWRDLNYLEVDNEEAAIRAAEKEVAGV